LEPIYKIKDLRYILKGKHFLGLPSFFKEVNPHKRGQFSPSLVLRISLFLSLSLSSGRI
jgi:hypothetical protein